MDNPFQLSYLHLHEQQQHQVDHQDEIYQIVNIIDILTNTFSKSVKSSVENEKLQFGGQQSISESTLHMKKKHKHIT